MDDAGHRLRTEFPLDIGGRVRGTTERGVFPGHTSGRHRRPVIPRVVEIDHRIAPEIVPRQLPVRAVHRKHVAVAPGFRGDGVEIGFQPPVVLVLVEIEVDVVVPRDQAAMAQHAKHGAVGGGVFDAMARQQSVGVFADVQQFVEDRLPQQQRRAAVDGKVGHDMLDGSDAVF